MRYAGSAASFPAAVQIRSVTAAWSKEPLDGAGSRGNSGDAAPAQVCFPGDGLVNDCRGGGGRRVVSAIHQAVVLLVYEVYAENPVLTTDFMVKINPLSSQGPFNVCRIWGLMIFSLSRLDK